MRPARPYVENSIDSRQNIEILLFSGQVRANDSIATTKIVAKNHPKLRNAGHIG
jgi:hypothetical protein